MTIIFAGGGTGGHLFPGIALAQELSRIRTQVFFLCTQRPFDAHQLTRYGFSYYALPSPRFKWSPVFLVNFIKSLWLSFKILKRFRPRVVIGLGGYGSVAPLIAAKILNIPIVLLEQNFLPGKVTRIFSAWAKWVFCQWAGSIKYLSNPLRGRITGSPLRQEIKRINRETACQKFGLNPDKKILAVIGGSQGAQALNCFLLDNIPVLKQYSDKLALVHLTGPVRGDLTSRNKIGQKFQSPDIANASNGAGETDYQVVEKVYQDAHIEHYVIDFCEAMAEVYSAADLVVSRAGGIALAEMTAQGLPMILVPFPYAAENHQYLNARELTLLGAAELIVQSTLSLNKMLFIIKDVLFNPDRLKMMSQASQKIARPQVSQEIISYLADMIK